MLDVNDHAGRFSFLTLIERKQPLFIIHKYHCGVLSADAPFPEAYGRSLNHQVDNATRFCTNNFHVNTCADTHLCRHVLSCNYFEGAVHNKFNSSSAMHNGSFWTPHRYSCRSSKPVKGPGFSGSTLRVSSLHCTPREKGS